MPLIKNPGYKTTPPTEMQIDERLWKGTQAPGYPQVHDGQDEEDHATARNPKLTESED
jgi:hypothetical protein